MKSCWKFGSRIVALHLCSKGMGFRLHLDLLAPCLDVSSGPKSCVQCSFHVPLRTHSSPTPSVQTLCETTVTSERLYSCLQIRQREGDT